MGRMSSRLVAQYEEGRRVWLGAVVARIVDGRVEKTFEASTSGLSSTEKALLVSHVGLSHIFGIAESDIAVQDFLTEHEVTRLISRHWRDGHFDVRLASRLEDVWACLYRLGIDTCTVRSELARELFNSQLGRRLQTAGNHRLNPDAQDLNVLAYLAEEPVSPLDTKTTGSFDLDVPSSHLPIVRASCIDQGPDVVQLVTMLELVACFPDDERSAWNDEALTIARNQHFMYASMVGGWPGPSPHDVPDWVRDSVTTTGARMSYASAGFVPGWFIVAESEDELSAIHRWTYDTSESFFAGQSPSGHFLLGFDMVLPSDGESVRAAWLYSLEDAVSASRLKTIVAMGLIRLDIYRIDADAQLEYVYSFGCPLPGDLVEGIREHLRKDESVGGEIPHFPAVTASERLLMMAQIEQHAFESLHHSLCADPQANLGIAFRKYLDVVDASTAAAFKEFPVDVQAHQAAHEALRLAMSASPRRSLQPIDMELLGRDRAYAQFRYAQDSPTRLVADVAYVAIDGETAVDSYEFPVTLKFDSAWSVERQSDALAQGFQELRGLLKLGISKIVINPHSVTYNLPYHEALLRLGFTEATYTHRAGSLAPRAPAQSQGVVAIGFAGEGKRHIKAVDTELAFVNELYGASAPDSLPHILPATVHISGHGHAGSKNYEVGIEIDAAGPPLSSARVLLDLDANDADLVFLSACSTGSGTYGPLQVTDTVPLDVAFIEKGARTVLSTSAPVNDYVACFFACTFHQARANGDGIWDAYKLAREATRDQAVPPGQPQLAAMFARIWPDWRNDLLKGAASCPDDWQLFRLSGRHWK